MYKQPLFLIGKVVATQGARAKVELIYMISCLGRHMFGDWGRVGEEDAKANNEAVKAGFRILSAYPIDENKPCEGYGDNILWVITEADRSVTTFLLPEEY